ncbi:MAG: Rne/Rng family ribonuclease [Clostridiales bacterium]|nr:Rne/Rng family ribonuclease [Clostridiales bacterium]
MKQIIVKGSNNNRIVTVVEDGKLIEKYEENEKIERLEGNIYLGKVTDILPGMQAAFVDIGDEKNAFLHIKDILPKKSNKTGNKNEDINEYNIKDYVKVGMPVIVEVKKDKTEKKGAKVSTNLNIAGKYIVIIPNCNFITYSQKIEDEFQIERLTEIVRKLNIQDYGIILRTSAVNAKEDEIKTDIESLINTYENIIKKVDNLKSKKDFNPTKLYEKGDIIKRLILDLGNQDLKKIIVNEEIIYNYVLKYINDIGMNIEIEFVKEDNIFEKYNIEHQLDKISNRKVWLKCGGFITIDRTEALTAIDVNTGKFVGKESIEQTVLKVNSEATVEIAKQLRLRDIGGIIIIDYIDMDKSEDEKIIYDLLIKCLKNDRAKTQVVGFTKLHLLEMTRRHICSE